MSKKESHFSFFDPLFIIQFHKKEQLSIHDQGGYWPNLSQITLLIKALQELKDNPQIIEEHNEKVERQNNSYKTEEELKALARQAGINWWEDSEPIKKKKSGLGYIYLIECGGLHKIGITKKNPKKRLKAYSTANPFDKTLLFCEKILNYKEAEDKIKEKFQHRLKKGHEWFKFSEKDIRRILNYLSKKRSSK